MLVIEGLWVEYPRDGGWVRAIDGIDVSLAAGDTLALVGESGCGKSTAALALLGLLPPGSRWGARRAMLDGIDLTRNDAATWRAVRGRRAGLVFQDPMTALNPHLRIGSLLCEPMQRHLGLGRRAARERAVELLTGVGLPDPAARLERFPHECSGGQRQRIALALALASKPQLLIADEPTTALDVTVQAQILALLESLCVRFGVALLLISHDLGVVAGLCRQVAVMYAGRVVETGTTSAVLGAPRHPYTRGLLACLPQGDPPPGGRLPSIPGQPPRLEAGWRGCAYAPRCSLAVAACRDAIPALNDGPQRWACPRSDVD